MLSILSESVLPFLGKLVAGGAGGMLIADPIAEKGLHALGYHTTETIPGEKIDINIGPARMDSNRAFGGLINRMDDYSNYTAKNPIMGKYVIPGTVATGIFGAGYLGKRLLNKKNTIGGVNQQ